MSVETDTETVLQDGFCAFKVKAEAETKVRENIFSIMAKENMAIIELSTQRHSLEDIFLQLTSEAGSYSESKVAQK